MKLLSRTFYYNEDQEPKIIDGRCSIRLYSDRWRMYFMKTAFKIIMILGIMGFVSCNNQNPKLLMSDIVVTTMTLGSVYTCAIEGYDTHYYLFTADATGGTYTIRLTNLASDCDWTVYNYDASYYYLKDMYNNPFDITTGAAHDDSSDEIGTVTLAANASYYIVVDEWSNINSYYTLQITKP
jgi:hypothetical protein